jgi:hypothetical protein
VQCPLRNHTQRVVEKIRLTDGHASWTSSYHWINYNDVEAELNHVRLETLDSLRHGIQVTVDITDRNWEKHAKRYTRNTCGPKWMKYTAEDVDAMKSD